MDFGGSAIIGATGIAGALNRRAQTKAGLGSAALVAAATISAPVAEDATPGAHREGPRHVPIADDVDVVVCGAGPAGVATALAAQRGCLPQEVPWESIKAALAKFDARLS